MLNCSIDMLHVRTASADVYAYTYMIEVIFTPVYMGTLYIDSFLSTLVLHIIILFLYFTVFTICSNGVN